MPRYPSVRFPNKSAKETAHFRRFTYAEIIARDKANLDFQWQQETTNTTQGETPQALMREILKDLEEAMRELAAAESGNATITTLDGSALGLSASVTMVNVVINKPAP